MHRAFCFSITLALIGLLYAGAALAQGSADPGEIQRRIEQLRPTPAPEAQPEVPTLVPAPRVEPGAEFSFVLTAVTIQGVTVFEAAELGPSYSDLLAREVGRAELAEIGSPSCTPMPGTFFRAQSCRRRKSKTAFCGCA